MNWILLILLQTENVIGELKPDVIIHAAAMTQVDQCEMEHDLCWKANVTGVENLIDACAKNQTHLVHVSTDFIFDGTMDRLTKLPFPDPVNFYGESKFAAEQALQQ